MSHTVEQLGGKRRSLNLGDPPKICLQFISKNIKRGHLLWIFNPLMTPVILYELNHFEPSCNRFKFVFSKRPCLQFQTFLLLTYLSSLGPWRLLRSARRLCHSSQSDTSTAASLHEYHPRFSSTFFSRSTSPPHTFRCSCQRNPGVVLGTCPQYEPYLSPLPLWYEGRHGTGLLPVASTTPRYLDGWVKISAGTCGETHPSLLGSVIVTLHNSFISFL